MGSRLFQGAAKPVFRKAGPNLDDLALQPLNDGFGAQWIDPQRASDVLEALLAEIFAGIGQLVADLVAHHPQVAEPARFWERLQTGRYVYTVLKDVVVLDDDVAEIDPDPEPELPVPGHPGFAIDHRPAAVPRHRAPHRRRSGIPPACHRQYS
jgi:hypothetical protein